MRRAISQSLGKSNERNRLCEEKTSDTDDDETRRRRMLGMEADFKKSWRVRNEQANFQKGVANFRNVSEAEGVCVNTPGCSSGSPILNKDTRSWPGFTQPVRDSLDNDKDTQRSSSNNVRGLALQA